MPILPGVIASSKKGAVGVYESIATVTGSGSSGTVTFSNIPATYQHLQIRYTAKYSATTSNAVTSILLQFNGNTGSNYAAHSLRGAGTVAGTSSTSATFMSSNYSIIPNNATGLANIFGVGIIDIHDYTSTSKNKTLRATLGVDTNLTATPVGQIVLMSGLWFATPAAITSISLLTGLNFWTTSSSFSLYGIKGA